MLELLNMEFLASLSVAILSAVFGFELSEYAKRKDERRKLLTALRIEIRLNIDAAQEILRINSEINFDAKDESQWKWCEVIPFSESAFNIVMNTGALYKFEPKIIQSLSLTATMIKRSNFAAEKIKAGRYDPREGKKYTLNVSETKEVLEAAMKILDN